MKKVPGFGIRYCSWGKALPLDTPYTSDIVVAVESILSGLQIWLLLRIGGVSDI